MNIKISRLGPGSLDHFREVILVFGNVFEMDPFEPPNDEYLQNLLSDDRFMVYAALHEEKVIAGMTAYVLPQYYHVRPIAYLYDLAVAVDYQRKGIGRKMIRRITDDCRANGFDELFVQADRIDDYALDFYRSTKPDAEEDVAHYVYGLNQQQGAK